MFNRPPTLPLPQFGGGDKKPNLGFSSGHDRWETLNWAITPFPARRGPKV